MRRILFAWELGANLGHLARDLPLARRCRREGFDVVFAVPDLRAAAAVFDGEGFTLVQAPRMQSPIQRRTPPLNYADVLLHAGYDDIRALYGSLCGWNGLMALTEPAVMVYDHAPTALLAARTAALPVMLVGNGFEIPPLRKALPSLLPWIDIPAQAFLDAEALALAHINACLDRFGTSGLGRLSEMFSGMLPLLTTFAELDHFGPRTDVQYVGPVHALPDLPRVAWASRRQGARIFAYLDPGAPGCENLLEALNQRGTESVCAIPGMPREWCVRYEKVTFFNHAIDLCGLLPEADLVITCGSGTVAAALLAGVPAAVLPRFGEQYLAGLRLQDIGAGRLLRQRASIADYADTISMILADAGVRGVARAFAARHAGFVQEHGVERQWQAMSRLLESTPCD